jgi:hypothetical protein
LTTEKCPLCESPCLIKIIATEDERWCKVDVCSTCGTMYPRGREVVKQAGPDLRKTKARPQPKKRPRGK